MNKQKYRIYYQSDGPSKGDPLGFIMSTEQIDYHLENLPTSLRLYFENKETTVEIESAPEDVGGGLYVTLTSSSDVDKLDGLLAECVKKENAATTGLSFFIDKA